jgi:hypothetical protein
MTSVLVEKIFVERNYLHSPSRFFNDNFVRTLLPGCNFDRKSCPLKYMAFNSVFIADSKNHIRFARNEYTV